MENENNDTSSETSNKYALLKDAIDDSDVDYVDKWRRYETDTNTKRLMINAIRQEDGGRTLLHSAVLAGSARIVEILRDEGANPNIQDKIEQKTALHMAASADNLDVVRALLASKNINPNIQDSFRAITALHLAVEYNKPDFVQELLMRGADPTIKDSNCRTAKQIASSGLIYNMVSDKTRQIITIFDEYSRAAKQWWEEERSIKGGGGVAGKHTDAVTPGGGREGARSAKVGNGEERGI